MAKFEEHGDENEDGARDGGKMTKGKGRSKRPPPVGKAAPPYPYPGGSKLGAQAGARGDVNPKVRQVANWKCFVVFQLLSGNIFGGWGGEIPFG